MTYHLLGYPLRFGSALIVRVHNCRSPLRKLSLPLSIVFDGRLSWSHLLEPCIVTSDSPRCDTCLHTLLEKTTSLSTKTSPSSCLPAALYLSRGCLLWRAVHSTAATLLFSYVGGQQIKTTRYVMASNARLLNRVEVLPSIVAVFTTFLSSLKTLMGKG